MGIRGENAVLFTYGRDSLEKQGGRVLYPKSSFEALPSELRKGVNKAFSEKRSECPQTVIT
jgi:hypothetical protein